MSDEGGDYDLVVQGGRVVDPADGVNAVLDVAVRDNCIAALASQIPVSPRARVLDAAGCLVTPGFIDHHVHCFEHVTDMGVHPDQVGAPAPLEDGHDHAVRRPDRQEVHDGGLQRHHE